MTSSSIRREDLSRVGLLPRAGLGTVAAAVANIVLAWLARTFLAIPEAFEHVQTWRVVLFTVVGCLLATGVFILVRRFADRPRRTFLWIAGAALALSFVPDALLLVQGEPGATWTGIIVLMVMHVVAAVLIVGALVAEGIGSSS